MSRTGHLRCRKDKNGNTRYQMIIEVWRAGIKYYKTKTFSSEKEALDWGRTIRYEIDKGLVSKESLKTRKLSHAIERYLSEVLTQKPRNARNVEQHLRWWKNEIGHLNLNDVTPTTIDSSRDKLLKGSTRQSEHRAPATVVRYICSISSVFEAAMKKWHWIEKNPVRMVEMPSVSNARTRFLSEMECKNLIDSCKQSQNPYLYSIVLLALCTGMRRGEILGLRWKDVDFEKKLIILERTKNGAMRYVPMISVAFQVLKNMFEKETILDLSYQIFPALNLNRHLDIRTAWEFALKRANLQGTGVVFHSLRHSCASFLAMSGASQRDIADILGHKDLRMTFRYSHLTQEHLGEKMERAVEKFIDKGV